jgi:hypothetical protein
MRTAISCVVLLALFLGGQGYAAEDESSTAVVPEGSNPALTVANFVRIQKFILDQGKTQTYCQAFNDNPYWPFPEFDAYLNPSRQHKDGKDEFNVLVIRTVRPGPDRLSDNQYWDVLPDAEKKGLLVQQHYTKKDPKVLIKEAEGFFRKALAEIDNLAKHKDKPKAGSAR